MQSIGIYEDYIAYARDPTSQVLGAASQFDYAQDDTGCVLLPPLKKPLTPGEVAPKVTERVRKQMKSLRDDIYLW